LAEIALTPALLILLIVLLVLGLLSFGLVAMIAYVIAGPDGEKQMAARAFHAPA